MRIAFIKKYNSILIIFLTILGFTCSCEPKEYGTPHAKFIVKGKVTSAETNQPVKGIHISMQWSPTVFSDNTGNYNVAVNSDNLSDTIKFDINFSDIDDNTNGSYKDLDTVVEFINPEYKNGDGDFYHGETTKEFNVKLTPKNTSK